MFESTEAFAPGSLRASLKYEPQALQFGTSGRRGEVRHLTQLEIYINARAELEYLQTLPIGEGGIAPGDTFYYARDLRPSSSRFAPEYEGRGEIAQAVERAIRDAGMQPVNLGRIPTPALMHFALECGCGSIMITGSHIPFDRNGYKVNTARGELLKKDEEPINRYVQEVRRRLYSQPCGESLFDARGMFKTGHQDLLPEIDAAREAYVQRYLRFFNGPSLTGTRLLVYQHSAVGRDILADILERLGVEVVTAGRSETFVPIDTENIDAAQLAAIQALLDAATAQHGPMDAVVSTDGDSDRPLILGVEAGHVRFFGGDLVGMIVAEFLGADAVVVPISCNDAIDRGPLASRLEPKTRIGSPYVIAGMELAYGKGRSAICGWEANGGFLTGSDITRNGRTLRTLPTRDAILPILAVLYAMAAQQCNLGALFARLPARFSRAALLKRFPRRTSMQILARFAPPDSAIKDVLYESGGITCLEGDGTRRSLPQAATAQLAAIREELGAFFATGPGGEIRRINYVDGVRISFISGDVVHVRPSGNADELRIYAVAATQARADAIASLGVAEPDGTLRRLERAVA